MWQSPKSTIAGHLASATRYNKQKPTRKWTVSLQTIRTIQTIFEKTKREQTDDFQTKRGRVQSMERGCTLQTNHSDDMLVSAPTDSTPNHVESIEVLHEQWKRRKTGREWLIWEWWLFRISSCHSLHELANNTTNGTPPRTGGEICSRCTQITITALQQTLKNKHFKNKKRIAVIPHQKAGRARKGCTVWYHVATSTI